MDPKLADQLAQAFPATTDAEVERAVTEGILLADDLVSSTPILKTLIGRDLRGHIRRAGVMFRIHDLCQRGDLPFETSIGKMPYGNWHHLEIRSGRFSAHVCRTLTAFDFPVDALSRQEAKLVNEPDLFADGKIVPIGELALNAQQLYAWLTFGVSRAGALEHLCWAMPPADEGEWLAHIDIRERKTVEAAKPAGTDVTSPHRTPLKLRFKDHIEEALQSNVDSENEAE